jgi:hypothetical protein
MAINTSGYSSDQFKNIGDIESQPMARSLDDNPEFLFPGRFVNDVYSDLSKGILGKVPVQRGFIRGIFPEIINKLQVTAEAKQAETNYTGVTAPIRRCFFQFNPSMILRSVQASSTTLNPLLQNPTQLLQAIPGQASFEFQILFNREHEVSGQVYRKTNGLIADTVPYNQPLDNYGSKAVTNAADASDNRAANPYVQSQVGDLGVLVDLYVLDSIIGQSITEDTISSILAYWQASRSLRGTGEKDADGKEINPYLDDNFSKTGEYASGLNNVLGNSAFLNPMPIRIVFSSLFMVEGFVTASNVAFHKFSENMVPTVCQVTLSVQALYIGFARKNSYITDQLEQQITQEIENAVADEAATKVAKGLLTKQFLAELTGMGFSYASWLADHGPGPAGELSGPYIYPFDPSGGGISYSLNSWWKAIYDVNKSFYDKNSTDFIKIRYILGNATTINTESLRFWVSDVFRKAVNDKAAITSFKIESLKLWFYDAAEVPAAFTDSKIVELSNTGKLQFGSYKTLKPIAKCNVFKLDGDGGGNISAKSHKKINLNTLDSKDLIKGSKADPTEMYWYTDDMEEVMAFDTKRIQANPNKYFGDSIKIVAQLKTVAEFSGAGGSTVQVPNIRTVVHTFDPNKPIPYGGPFDIDFGFYIDNQVTP